MKRTMAEIRHQISKRYLHNACKFFEGTTDGITFKIPRLPESVVKTVNQLQGARVGMKSFRNCPISIPEINRPKTFNPGLFFDHPFFQLFRFLFFPGSLTRVHYLRLSIFLVYL